MKVSEWLGVNVFLVLIACVGAGVFLAAGKLAIAFGLQDEWWVGYLIGLLGVAASVWFAMASVRFIARRPQSNRARARE